MITGLGFVTPLGNDVRTTWDALVAGRSGAGPITRFDPVQSSVKFACEVKGFDASRYLEKKEVRRFDPFAQYAIGAGEEAVGDACLLNNWESIDLKRVGVLIGIFWHRIGRVSRIPMIRAPNAVAKRAPMIG